MDTVAITHNRIRVNDVRLHYVTAGSGSPVVLLHGFPQSWYTWRFIIPALAEHYTVIAPDLRGVGDSSKPVGGYDKKSAAGDIHELVRALGYRRIRLVGHDIGGWVAYPYAAQWPDEVEQLVVMQAIAPGFGLDRNINRSWHFRFQMEPDLPEALVSGHERIYLSRFLTNGVYDPSAVTADALEEYLRCFMLPGAPRAFFNYYRALPQDAEDNAKLAQTKITMPVLALGGEHAEKDNVVLSLQQLATDVQGGTVERSGHYIPEERPDRLIELLLEFFGSHEPGIDERAATR